MAAPYLYPVATGQQDPDDDPQGDLQSDLQDDVAGYPDRPPLEVTGEAEAADWLRRRLGIDLLAGYFRRGEDVVHAAAVTANGYVPPVAEDEGAASPVRRTSVDQLTARVQYLHWPYKMTGGSKNAGPTPTPVMFPRSAAQTALAAPDLLTNIRDLRGVVHTPVVRVDGTVLDRPGYDEESGLLYLPSAGLEVRPVPVWPTEAQSRGALDLVEEMIAGFAFVSDHDRANYVGLLLTPLLREVCPPPYKLGAIGAPQPGSGKTLLATCARLLHGGVFRSEVPEDDSELRKQITAILDATTGPVVNFDNATGTIRSSVLAGLLTSGQWDDRRLGASDMVSRPNDRCWLITGNNLKLGGDLVRRTVWVTIDPGCPDPHLRTNFAISDLEGWVRERRGELLHALLVLIRSWVVAGSPMERRSGDGYGHWTAVVDGILRYAGMPGRFDHPDSVRQEVGADDQEWADFLGAVQRVWGTAEWTAKELLEHIDDGSRDWGGPDAAWLAAHPFSPDVLPTELSAKLFRQGANPRGLTRLLGVWLGNRDGRWAGGLTVRNAGRDRNKVIQWRIEEAKQ